MTTWIAMLWNSASKVTCWIFSNHFFSLAYFHDLNFSLILTFLQLIVESCLNVFFISYYQYHITIVKYETIRMECIFSTLTIAPCLTKVLLIKMKSLIFFNWKIRHENCWRKTEFSLRQWWTLQICFETIFMYF